jgi:peroxiredoxin
MKFRSLLKLAAVSTLFGSALAVEPGAKAPDFEAKNLAGKTISLSDFEDKIVVLEWFNYGCPFVKKHYASGNMPGLQKKYRDKGVVWLSINSSAEGKQGYLPADKMSEASKAEGHAATEILLDPSGEVGKAYGAKVTPHLFVIHKDGKIAYAGGIDDKPTVEASDIEGATNYVAAALDALLAGEEVETKSAKPYGCGVKY